MSDHDPGWRELGPGVPAQPERMAALVRTMMELANQRSDTVFAMISELLEHEAGMGLFGPEYEGKIVGVDDVSDPVQLILEDVVVMQSVEDELGKENFDTLGQYEEFRISLAVIGEIRFANFRVANDYAPL